MNNLRQLLYNQYLYFLVWLGATPPQNCCDDTLRELGDLSGLDLTKEAWQHHLDQTLPPKETAIARNAAITRFYACLYLDRPDLFKWAGMAAFASHRVGFFLVEGDFANLDVELMRTTNNQVFEDIAWAHILYREKGFDSLKPILEDDPSQSLLLKGFELIHQGEQLLNSQNQETLAQANDLIWRGNLLLLKQEQSVTVQNSFKEFSYNFKLSLDSLAWATTLDFDANNLASDKASRTSFELYEQESRTALDFTRFEDRWAWTISEALPKWMAVEKTKAQHTLSVMVFCKDSSLPIATINWLKRGKITSAFISVDLAIEAMSSISQFQRLATMAGNIMTEVLLKWVLLPPGSQQRDTPNSAPPPS